MKKISPSLGDKVQKNTALSEKKDEAKSIRKLKGRELMLADNSEAEQLIMPMKKTAEHSLVLKLSQRKVIENKEGSISVEQGPIHLTETAKLERQYWFYNEGPMTVFRGEQSSPEDLIKQNGLHCRALASQGVEFHLRSGSANDTSGAISTTTSLEMARHYAAYKAKVKPDQSAYLYKIDLYQEQGIDVLETLYRKSDAIYGYDTPPSDPDVARTWKTIIDQAIDEAEVSIIGSISVDQISVWDKVSLCFVPLLELSPFDSGRLGYDPDYEE